nr:putative ribonuclease H-like domain-containing protein [Tanacetum cinerariifolium]
RGYRGCQRCIRLLEALERVCGWIGIYPALRVCEMKREGKLRMKGFDSDEDESEEMVLKYDNVQHKPEQANQPRKVSQNHRNYRTNWNEMSTQKLGVGFQFTKKACFVCGSFSHLIKDYDFHDKKDGTKTCVEKCRKGNSLEGAILTKSGIVPISTAKHSSSRAATSVSAARPINTAASKTLVNVANTIQNALQTSHSLSRRHFYQQTTLKNINLNNNVNTAKAYSVNTAKGKKVKVLLGIKGLMLLSHQHAGFGDLKLKYMIMSPKTVDHTFVSNLTMLIQKADSRNISYLTDFKEHDEGYVAFRRGAKGGGGPEWLFDINALSKSMNYAPVLAGTHSNGFAGKGASFDAVNTATPIYADYPNIPLMPDLEDARIFDDAYDDRDKGAEADYNNLETIISFSIDYDEVFARVARIEAIRLFLAYASFMDFTVYQMDVKSTFLYGTIKEEVYVSQPPGFVDPEFPDRVYKVEKALYGFHQAPRAWYETLSTYLLDNGFRRGTIDKTLFIKQIKDNILLVQVYVDDIIFGSTKRSLSTEFEQFMHKRFQMRSMRELTFFLGLQVKQRKGGIFLSQDKYVCDILKKFVFSGVKSASILMETHKPLSKDAARTDVDVHLYRSMISLLMYLTSSRSDIMFVVCACSTFQVQPKTHLKGQPTLGLWYPKDSPLELIAYSDSDYTGASLDIKSTTGGCQFLGSRLISWQCKKQTIVANSTTEAEYIAASNCYGQTKIHVDNESAICVVKNPVYHSKTKHIEFRHHFIRDSYKKRLIEMVKIHIDYNVADLLTKAFDVTRF